MYLLASFFNVQKTEMVFEQFIQYDPIWSWIKQPLEGPFSHIKVWLVGLIKLNYLMAYPWCQHHGRGHLADWIELDI